MLLSDLETDKDILKKYDTMIEMEQNYNYEDEENDNNNNNEDKTPKEKK